MTATVMKTIRIKTPVIRRETLSAEVTMGMVTPVEAFMKIPPTTAPAIEITSYVKIISFVVPEDVFAITGMTIPLVITGQVLEEIFFNEQVTESVMHGTI